MGKDVLVKRRNPPRVESDITYKISMVIDCQIINPVQLLIAFNETRLMTPISYKFR
jgi:hypothetical protein